MSKRSPAPPGGLAEIDMDLIDEGQFRADFDAQLRKAYRDLMEYENASGNKSGKAKIVATIELSRNQVDRHFNIRHQVKTVTPRPLRTSIVKERGGRLLCQPIGASQHDPDQQTFFDEQGRPITGEEEGEEAHPNPVVGTIRKAQGA